MKLRSMAIVLVAVLAALAVGALAGRAGAELASCAALVADETAQQAAQELRHYASDMQAETFQDGSMGHVLTVLDLAEQLDNAPRYGCAARVVRPPSPGLPPVLEVTR